MQDKNIERVLSLSNGVIDDIVFADCNLSAEDAFCKEIIENVCRWKDSIVNEYLNITKKWMVINPSDGFYDILVANDNIAAFIEFCSNTKGITIEQNSAKITTDSGTCEIILKNDDSFSEKEKVILKRRMENKLKMYDIEDVELVDEDIENVLKEIQNKRTEEEAIDFVLNGIWELLESNKEY